MSRSAPALLLSLVYAAALAVALTDLGQHAVAGLLVLGGLTARWFVRSRRSSAAPTLAVVPDPVPTALDVLPAAARAA